MLKHTSILRGRIWWWNMCWSIQSVQWHKRRRRAFQSSSRIVCFVSHHSQRHRRPRLWLCCCVSSFTFSLTLSPSQTEPTCCWSILRGVSPLKLGMSRDAFPFKNKRNAFLISLQLGANHALTLSSLFADFYTTFFYLSWLARSL